ncbi:hypothetical protein ACKI1I_17480 [Streptomyces turgidiscabies]|uniref:hypothetical protein n=1 Tax=Streptomyces turgidiscabies TaxID=85558 RepID=UPI0038F6A0F0
MHSEGRSLTLTPGTDARQQLTSKILATNELVQQAMERLAALDGSQYAAVPGSRPSLDALASVVFAASIAASDLAGALQANPHGTRRPSPPWRSASRTPPTGSTWHAPAATTSPVVSPGT